MCVCVFVREATTDHCNKMKKFLMCAGLWTKSKHREWKSTYRHDLFIHPSPKSVSVMFEKIYSFAIAFVCQPYITLLLLFAFRILLMRKEGRSWFFLDFHRGKDLSQGWMIIMLMRMLLCFIMKNGKNKMM